jgi:hypothetical protein
MKKKLSKLGRKYTEDCNTPGIEFWVSELQLQTGATIKSTAVQEVVAGRKNVLILDGETKLEVILFKRCAPDGGPCDSNYEIDLNLVRGESGASTRTYEYNSNPQAKVGKKVIVAACLSSMGS